jgi:hypothetical protein
MKAMKKLNYSIIMLAILIASCSSNKGNGTAIDENLPAIAQKLKTLEVSFIQDDAPDTSQRKTNSLKKTISSRNSIFSKKTQNKQASDCKHEVVVEDYSNGSYVYLLIEKYFTDKGVPTTNCEIDTLFDNVEPPFSLGYIIEQDLTNNFENNYVVTNSIIKHEETLKINSLTSMTGIIKHNSDITGTMSLNSSLFELLNGSHINLKLDATFHPDATLDEMFSADDFSFDLKYIIGFEVNSEDYHFDMLIDMKELLSLEESESDLMAEYNLLNSSNQKIGTIKYSLDGNGNEEFSLYDLDGNKVE